ncbi:hypothetical protein BDV40DRAFT_294973 [Aspergillus tamarii]|uniref:Steroid 5-alpha reductase C-terminal domain-containing protein n=1 Tax=Aspergillus tamarii TaxID=41984 RepID=A0A5N6VA06_ASPTM|nr:hypothetical protein BDV40DRAFT_294973 [Aspergillus tamarii]
MAPGELRDNVSRLKSPSPIGRGLFVGLRAADVFWQYSLISRGWGMRLIEKLGGTAIHYPIGLNIMDLVRLQPYQSLVTLLALGSSVKQIVHMLFVSEQEMDAASGVAIPFFNTFFNSINTILSIWALSSPASSISQSASLSGLVSTPLVAAGMAAYTIGLLTEAVSEFQRKAFKQNPANRGKIYSGGLFSLATNINYGAYTVWRAGYAMVCGGFLWGATTGAFFFYDFASRGVPVLDQYLSKTYGDQYREVKASVKYSLIPGVY